MKTSIQILLLLALFSLLALTSAQETVTYENTETGETESGEETETSGSGADAFNACDPGNRPQACTADFTPVCGYIYGCLGGNCTNTFSNGCDACSNSTVSGYVNGSCEDVQTTCDLYNRPLVCALTYTATCLVASNCQGLFCFANTSNSCDACSMVGVGYSLPGICPGPDLSSEVQSCPLNRPLICTADYNPVCAHLSSCVGRNCWSTAGNSCSACADHNVDTYIDGECPEVFNNEEGFLNEEGFINEEGELGLTQCAAATFPVVCPLDENPVCAHFSGCEGNFADCTRTESNGCNACSQWNVDYYFDGQCPS